MAGECAEAAREVPTSPRPRTLGALRHRNFALLWSSLIVSNAGIWMQWVGQGWLVLELTNRPVYLGIVSLAFALPMTLLPPFGGAIADRFDKLRLLTVTQTLAMLSALLLAILTLTGAVQVGHVIAIAFLNALLLAVDNPTRQALLPALVGREDLMSAISLNSAVFTGAALFGPALGGLLLAYIGSGGLFLINALSYLVVLVAILLMRGVDASPHPGGAGLLADVVEGLRYIYHTRILMLLVAISALSGVLGRSFAVLLPVFARDVWRVGGEGYGFLASAPGAGALLGAIGLGVYGEVKRKGRLLLLSLLVFSVALVGFAYSPAYWPALLLLVVTGVTGSLFGTSIATLIQTTVPGRLRGRAMSVYTVTVIGVPSLGALGTAALAEWIGPRTSIGLGAALLGVVSLLLLLRGDLRSAA